MLPRCRRRSCRLPARPAKNATLFFEFSLCLSRACLGKMFSFIYKWRKKWRFSHRDVTQALCGRKVVVDRVADVVDDDDDGEAAAADAAPEEQAPRPPAQLRVEAVRKHDVARAPALPPAHHTPPPKTAACERQPPGGAPGGREAGCLSAGKGSSYRALRQQPVSNIQRCHAMSSMLGGYASPFSSMQWS
jgi:hypothetical protein